jgi:hypothetical protein
VSSPLRGEAAAGDLTAGELTGGENRAVSASPSSVWLTRGVTDPPICLLSRLRVHCTGCTQHFQRLLLKGFLKMIFLEIIKRVSKIHNLLILAPKIVKQIL